MHNMMPYNSQFHRSMVFRAMAFGFSVVALPVAASAQVPPRFYWKSLAGANAVPVIYQSLSGNSNPADPARLVIPDATLEADLLVAGYAKLIPVMGRTCTVALLQPMGRLSSDAIVNGNSFHEEATGYGDPMLELGINIVGPSAIQDLSDLLRYEPGLSIDIIMDLAFPIGEYDSDTTLNIGQNRWYGRLGVPLVWQLGPWIPGQRTTLEMMPSIWLFGDNNDFGGRTLSTDPIFQIDTHITRDFTEHFWGSADVTYMTGGESTIDATSSDAIDNLGVGFTLGYQINDNISLTLGYMSTVNDSDPEDLRMNGFRISFTYGWHRIVEGQKRLDSGH